MRLHFSLGVFAIVFCASIHGDAAQAARKPKSKVADSEDCLRAQPAPVLLPIKPGGPKPTFQLEGPQTATETLDIDDKTSLVVHHSGCEYFVEEYVFTVKGPAGDKSAAARLRQAALLMRGLRLRESSGDQAERMAKFLEGRAVRKSEYRFRTTLSMSSTESVSLDVDSSRKNEVRLSIKYQILL